MKTTIMKFCICFINNALKTPISWAPGVSAFNALNYFTWQKNLAGKNRRFKFIVYTNKIKYDEITTICECVEKLLMIIGCNI